MINQLIRHIMALLRPFTGCLTHCKFPSQCTRCTNSDAMAFALTITVIIIIIINHPSTASHQKSPLTMLTPSSLSVVLLTIHEPVALQLSDPCTSHSLYPSLG